MTLQPEDIDFMQRAFELAEESGKSGSGAPIGSVIVLEGRIIGQGRNCVAASNDPTAHAEITAIRDASSKLQRSRFEGAALYSTLQPCGMCTMASIWAGISRLIFGAERGQVHEMYFENRNLDISDYVRDAFKDDLSMTGGVLAEQCAALYYKPEDEPPEEEQANK